MQTATKDTKGISMKESVKMKYSVGDRVVHPMHGAGFVEDITDIEIGGKRKKYYALKFAVGNMVTNIPVENADKIGIRTVISREEAKKVMESFCAYEICDDTNWNKRQRENLVKIKSGDIYVVLGVLKELMYRDRIKGLSTSERKTLASARQIVISELVMSGYADFESVEEIMGDSVEQCVSTKGNA